MFFCTDRDKMYGRSGDPNAEASKTGGSVVAEKLKAPTTLCIDRFLSKGLYDGACLCSEASGLQQVKSFNLRLLLHEEDSVETGLMFLFCMESPKHYKRERYLDCRSSGGMSNVLWNYQLFLSIDKHTLVKHFSIH